MIFCLLQVNPCLLLAYKSIKAPKYGASRHLRVEDRARTGDPQNHNLML